MKKLTSYLTFMLILFITLAAFVNRDNKSYLEELKKSAMFVIKSNQDLINKNSDGSYSDKRLSPEKFSKSTAAHFKVMTTSEKWRVEDLQNNHDYKQLAKAVSTYLAASRIIVATYQGLINKDKDGSTYLKHFYPAVFGRLVADEFKKRTGIYVKQTTSGKGTGPRNKTYNKPDQWEKNVLAKFEAPEWERGEGYGEIVNEGGKEFYRYMRPLEIKRACLSCHGGPTGEQDISGHKKEGYKLKEVRGGISVKIAVN